MLLSYKERHLLCYYYIQQNRYPQLRIWSSKEVDCQLHNNDYLHISPKSVLCHRSPAEVHAEPFLENLPALKKKKKQTVSQKKFAAPE